jgi:hypothetical protein
MDSAVSAIQKVVPEHERTYPEPAKMGVMPSYGFFIRHVKNMQLNNVEVSYTGAETRPPFVLDDVKGIDIIHCKAQAVKGAALFMMSNVTNFIMHQSMGLPDRKIVQASKASF